MSSKLQPPTRHDLFSQLCSAQPLVFPARHGLFGQRPGVGGGGPRPPPRSQDEQLKELQEAQKLELDLGRRLSSGAEATRPAATAFRSRGPGAERFEELLFRALPKLSPPLRELVLDLNFQGDAFGPGPGGFRSVRRCAAGQSSGPLLSAFWQALTGPGPWPRASSTKGSCSSCGWGWLRTVLVGGLSFRSSSSLFVS